MDFEASRLHEVFEVLKEIAVFLPQFAGSLPLQEGMFVFGRLFSSRQRIRIQKQASELVLSETPTDCWVAVTAAALQSGTMVILNTATSPACACQIISLTVL